MYFNIINAFKKYSCSRAHRFTTKDIFFNLRTQLFLISTNSNVII